MASDQGISGSSVGAGAGSGSASGAAGFGSGFGAGLDEGFALGADCAGFPAADPDLFAPLPDFIGADVRSTDSAPFDEDDEFFGESASVAFFPKFDTARPNPRAAFPALSPM